MPLRVRSIIIGIGHLQSRLGSFIGPRVHLILRDACGCDDGSAMPRTCSHDLAGRLRSESEGKKCPAHPRSGQIDRAQQATPESATLRSLSEHLTLVTAITSSLLRHGCKISEVPPTRFIDNLFGKLKRFSHCVVTVGKEKERHSPIRHLSLA
jgi:hypothetical protein